MSQVSGVAADEDGEGLEVPVSPGAVPEGATKEQAFVDERDEECGDFDGDGVGDGLNLDPPSAGRNISIARGEKELPRVTDHFSLSRPSSQVRFRRSNVRVYEQRDSQIVLEERLRMSEQAGGGGGGGEGGGGPGSAGGAHAHDVRITVKEMKDNGHGLTALRCVYSLVAIFMGGFVFIFSLELLLFLFMDLAAEVGATKTKDLSVVAFIGVLLSVPVFIYALGVAMTIVTRFVADTWQGHPFLRTFGKWSSVVTDWAAFAMYLGIPFVTIVVTLFARLANWWAISALTWFSSVLIFWAFFAGCVLYYEIKSALYLIDELRPDSESNRDDMTVREKIKRAILNTQKARWAGVKQEAYMVDGDTEVPESGSYTDSDEIPFTKHIGLYSRLTLWHRLGCIFTKMETPHRLWSLDEARGNTPFVTNDSWSLEKLYCRDTSARYIAVVKGPSAVTLAQGKSSFVCAILGSTLFLLIVIGMLVWFEASGAVLVIVCILILLCCLPSTRTSVRLMKMYRDVADPPAKESLTADDAVTKESSAIYQVYESFRVSTPNDLFCWTIFTLEVVFLFFLPFIHLCTAGNLPGAILFGLLGILSGVRVYLNPAIILKEIGNFGSLGMKGVVEKASRPDLFGATQKREWEAKSRLSEIVGSISSGKSRRPWNIVFAILVLFFVLVVIGAVSQGGGSAQESGSTASEKMVTVEGFKYDPQPHLPYPNCQLKKGFTIPASVKLNASVAGTGLLDYAFLANIAYVKQPEDEVPYSDSSQALLDTWFGANAAIENVELVNRFKNEEGYGTSAVSYKFITATAFSRFGIVAIRGTANLWDVMADAQLWLAAGLFQGLREVLPIGSLWTPILHKTVKFVSALETSSLERVSFYKETTRFVQWLQESGNYTTLQVTGHSLGGGLALITGSQTNISAVGLSAPNAMLSRETFQPALTEAQLNSLTFNIVPARDVIPMLDDKAALYQNIECRAGANAFASCHGSTRSLCEIMYTCGSSNRPVICNCAEYGYPPPTPVGENADFAQACAEAGYNPTTA